MPKFVWEKWFPQDWKSDPQLSRCTPATRGIWVDAICSMMMTGTYKLEGTAEELSRDCRCTKQEILTANDDLKKCQAAEVSMQKGCIIWICRRLARKYNIKGLRSNAANKRWCKHDANTLQPQDANAMQTPMQTSASDSDSASLEEGGTGEGVNHYHKNTRAALHILNEASGRHFRETDANLTFISARLKEPEVTIEGVRQMIERQCRRWKETDQAEYLRPETLFNKTKFDGYYAARDLPINEHMPNGFRPVKSLAEKELDSIR